MLSQSAKATAASESRFRIANPNSAGRSALVVALDEPSRSLLWRIADHEWTGARFRTFERTTGDAVKLASADGAPSDLEEELEGTDVVIMIARAGSDTAIAAEAIGSACFARPIMTAGFVIDGHSERTTLERTLSGMRPYVISLAAGFDEEVLVGALTAIRA